MRSWIHRQSEKYGPSRHADSVRRGVTFLEMVISMAVIAMLMVGMAGLSMTAQEGAEFSRGYGDTTRHAQIVLNRISRTIEGASATKDTPGVIVLDEVVGTWQFPYTLVVWAPESGEPADAANGPLVSELVVYTPNPLALNELLEITDRNNTARAMGSLAYIDWVQVGTLTGWRNAVASMLANNDNTKTVLTDRMRIASTSMVHDDISGHWRACVRFESDVRPSRAEWWGYEAAPTTINWKNLSWAQGIYGSQTGLRQTTVRFEIQLQPEPSTVAGDSETMPPLPFFGSAVLRYELDR